MGECAGWWFGIWVSPRVSLALNPGYASYVYGQEGLIAEVTSSGGITTSYGYMPGSDWGTAPLFIGQTGNFGYSHSDHLGTPRVITSSSGAILWRADYAVFGAANLAVQTFVNNFRFPGQYFDAETGLHYNYFRTYDPGTGRYLESDPIGLVGGLNTYLYANANPLTYADPTGEFGVVGGAIGFGVDVALQLAMNGGRWECIDWGDVAVATALGAVGGGALGGAFKLSKGSMKWANSSRRYRRQHNVPSSHDVHHWAIPRRSHVPDAIKNHPANLNPIPRSVHRNIHSDDSSALYRWWHGTPDWAKVTEGAAAGYAADAAMGGDCDDRCN